MTRNPRHLLEDAGARDVPGPDAAFADALEARLRAVAVSAPPAAPVATAPTRRRQSFGWARPMLAGLVATAIVLAAIAQGGLAPKSPTPGLELSAAVNVTVQLPDGTTVENPEGMILPEGAIVTVGEGGSARIGNVTVNPGETVVVHGGRAQVERPKPSVSKTAAPTPSAGPQSATPSGAIGSSEPGPSPDPSAPAESASPAPGTSADPSATPTPTPAATASPAPTPKPKPVVVLAPRLRVRLAAAHTIAVDWTRTAGAKSYVLLMTRSKVGVAPRPTYPGTRVLATFSRPPAAAVQFVLAPGVVQVKLLVVALDKDGHELGRSRIVRVIVVAPVASPSASASPVASPSAS